MLNRQTPMRRGAPLRRSGWIRSKPEQKKAPGLGARIAKALGLAPKHQPKGPTYFRSEQHRRNVAALTCANCRKEGQSQAAHLNLLALGKGRGLKVSDAFLIPLCTTGFLQNGCHYLLDQAGHYDKATSASLQIGWLQDTRTELINRGQWPESAQRDVDRFLAPYLARGDV